MKVRREGMPDPFDHLGGQNIILDSIADGVFTVDHDWRITSFNRAAEKITGVARDEAIGQLCKDVLKADTCERSCCLRATMKNGLRSRPGTLPGDIGSIVLPDGSVDRLIRRGARFSRGDLHQAEAAGCS